MSGVPNALAGLMSSDAMPDYYQQVADLRDKYGLPPLEGSGGKGVGGNPGAGDSGRVIAPDYSASPYEAINSARGRDNEQQLLEQRRRQINYDQKLAYPDKSDRPPSGELSAIKDRLNELKAATGLDYRALQDRINALPKDSPARSRLEDQLNGMSAKKGYNPPVQTPEIVPDEEIVERMKPARYGPAKGTKYRPRSQ